MRKGEVLALRWKDYWPEPDAEHFIIRRRFRDKAPNRDRGNNTMLLDGHSMRHTLASYLRACVVAGRTIRRHCGWSSVKVAEQYSDCLNVDLIKTIKENAVRSG